ncbi:MAG: DUF116 domain-containing protein [Candidatus Brocadiaceae bacterium]|jgi:hypothetical protein
MGRRIVKMMNALTRLRRSRCRPEELLILVPSCLQRSDCRQKITNDINECRRCGRCKVKDIIELGERYGVRCAVATGGRLALEMAMETDVKAVVAIACEKELQQGMFSMFPKPGLGIINIRPHGPCKDTDVDLEEVEEAIQWILRD